MATNEFLPWATAGGANVTSQADYAAAAARLAGVVAGTASSALANKTWRQAAFIASVIGQLVADHSGGDALDNGDAAALLLGLERALQSGDINWGGTAGGTANALTVTLDPQPVSWARLVGSQINFIVGVTNTGAATLAVTGLTGTKPIVRPGGAALKASDLVAGAVFRGMYDGTSIQMAGITQSAPGTVTVYATPGTTNWTVPAGIFKIRARVWGAGGGGGALIAGATSGSGAGGNGGGYAEGVYSVTPGQILSIIVGAGGAKGTSAGFGTNGQAGGTSSVGSLLSATGGGGGNTGYTSYAATASSTVGAGTGGQINQLGQQAANSYIIGSAYIASAGGGAFNTPGTPITVGNSFKGMQPGGGSSGVSAVVSDAQDGADGMVIIEY